MHLFHISHSAGEYMNFVNYNVDSHNPCSITCISEEQRNFNALDNYKQESLPFPRHKKICQLSQLRILPPKLENPDSSMYRITKKNIEKKFR